MGFENRGGFPHVLRTDITSTAAYHHFWKFISKHVQIRSMTHPIKMYFSAVDAAADVNYIVIPVVAPTTTEINWEGPLEVNQVWLQAIDGTTEIEFVAYQRRG